MKKLFLGLLVGACTFVSCKKDSSAPPAPAATSKVSDWSELCDVPNPGNPFDRAGSEHNRLVAVCEASGSATMSLDEVFALTDRTLREEGMEIGSGSAAFATPILTAMEGETEGEMRGYINSLPTTEAQKAQLNSLVTIMLRYDGTNLCEIIDNIKSFENMLLSTYGASEMQAVLIASSIGRYSLAYWHERVSAGGATLKTTKGFWKKLFVGVCDAIGGAGGAVAGSATVVGGIAGGVVGAIGASNGAAKLWDVFAAKG